MIFWTGLATLIIVVWCIYEELSWQEKEENLKFDNIMKDVNRDIDMLYREQNKKTSKKKGKSK